MTVIPDRLELEWWQSEFHRFRRRVYILIIVGFILILSGFVVIVASYWTGQQDIKNVTCANTQSLITQFEWLNALATKNQNHLLTAGQVAQRQQFYRMAEQLAYERADHTCVTLPAMKMEAATVINQVFKP